MLKIAAEEQPVRNFIFTVLTSLFLSSCGGGSSGKSGPVYQQPTEYNPSLSPVSTLKGSAWGLKEISPSGMVSEITFDFKNTGILEVSNRCSLGNDMTGVSAQTPFSEFPVLNDQGAPTGMGRIAVFSDAESEIDLNGESCHVSIDADTLKYVISGSKTLLHSERFSTEFTFYRIR